MSELRRERPERRHQPCRPRRSPGEQLASGGMITDEMIKHDELPLSSATWPGAGGLRGGCMVGDGGFVIGLGGFVIGYVS